MATDVELGGGRPGADESRALHGPDEQVELPPEEQRILRLHALRQRVERGVHTGIGAARALEHELEDPEALRSFTYSIAVRVLRWDLRRRWIRRGVRLLPAGALPERVTPSDNFEARQAVARFYDILDRLGDRDRIAFVLQNMEGLTLQESARSLGVSVANR